MSLYTLLGILIGLVIALVISSFLIITESAGYKGPSKVWIEKYKRSFKQHPEMRHVEKHETLLTFNPEDLLGNNKNTDIIG